ncbi:hypothetical protein BLNAU_82 [Blattamonas nauphoetae]|uniref:Uncharacterized protein n=1 Tax=Blattamonas nauphoetae TaxID=2049346 RepID=A0ABQ9YM12_9EUKA|nr:hypothetical protein BLNAU_82 [Blattamonas nauphoetae]
MSFKSTNLLFTQGALAPIWHAGTTSKLPKRIVERVDLVGTSELITKSISPAHIRQGGILLLGLVRIFDKKSRLLHLSLVDSATRLTHSVRTAHIDLPMEQRHVKRRTITLSDRATGELVNIGDDILNVRRTTGSSLSGFDIQRDNGELEAFMTLPEVGFTDWDKIAEFAYAEDLPFDLNENIHQDITRTPSFFSGHDFNAPPSPVHTPTDFTASPSQLTPTHHLFSPLDIAQPVHPATLHHSQTRAQTSSLLSSTLLSILLSNPETPNLFTLLSAPDYLDRLSEVLAECSNPLIDETMELDRETLQDWLNDPSDLVKDTTEHEEPKLPPVLASLVKTHSHESLLSVINEALFASPSTEDSVDVRRLRTFLSSTSFETAAGDFAICVEGDGGIKRSLWEIEDYGDEPDGSITWTLNNWTKEQRLETLQEQMMETEEDVRTPTPPPVETPLFDLRQETPETARVFSEIVESEARPTRQRRKPIRFSEPSSPIETPHRHSPITMGSRSIPDGIRLTPIIADTESQERMERDELVEGPTAVEQSTQDLFSSFYHRIHSVIRKEKDWNGVFHVRAESPSPSPPPSPTLGGHPLRRRREVDSSPSTYLEKQREKKRRMGNETVSGILKFLLLLEDRKTDLFTELVDEDKQVSISSKQLMNGVSRRRKARLFLSLLVLEGNGMVKMTQARPYDTIRIRGNIERIEEIL